jgi:hypothetical protein
MKKLFTLLLITINFFAFAQKPKLKPSTSIYESLKINRTPTDFIKVSYLEPLDTSYNVWYETFREDKVMEKVAAALNAVFKITKPLKITCMECGEVNAFYNPEKKELQICYDLFEDMVNKMSKYHSDPDSLGTKIGMAFSFILYHEIGHAFIDLFKIPITGKEEDAADYFAFYMLGSNGVPEGVSACIEGANFFKDMHNEMKQDTIYQRINKEGNIVDALPYWDEHSFSLQRYYSINSLIFGSNPDANWDMVEKGLIGYRRPKNAIQEFEKIKKGWDNVLKNHLKLKR